MISPCAIAGRLADAVLGREDIPVERGPAWAPDSKVYVPIPAPPPPPRDA